MKVSPPSAFVGSFLYTVLVSDPEYRPDENGTATPPATTSPTIGTVDDVGESVPPGERVVARTKDGTRHAQAVTNAMPAQCCKFIGGPLFQKLLSSGFGLGQE